MSSFFVDLFESIFTPGPTPSILKAANGSFAALQLVLFGLLVGTHSVHFVVLSVLCAGLWWSVNWFAAELKLAQQREAEQAAAAAGGSSGDKAAGAPPEADDSSDTEVEGSSSRGKGRPVGRKGRKAAAAVEPVEPIGELKHRGSDSQGGTQSSVSTEDEWEKVSESEREKDK